MFRRVGRGTSTSPRGSTNAMHGRRCSGRTCSVEAMSSHRAAEGGGGIKALIEATGLRTLENLVGNIDPAILVHAYDNDARRAPTLPDRSRLRRLSPDVTLLQRRVAGEPLRRIALNYGVSHTTLGRWFRRPSVARQMEELKRRQRPCVPAPPAGRNAR